MKLTKLEHACLILEAQGQKLIIDPGLFVKDLGDLRHVAAVVITHEHPDHTDQAHLAKIVAANPDVPILAPPEVLAQLASEHARAVQNGDELQAGPFKLQFFGALHAEVHSSVARIQNVGVLVNDVFYYPGDSFTLPEDAKVKLLAVPASAPWLKIGEAMDFVAEVKPARCFPTHNALLSDAGKASANQWLGQICAAHNVSYEALTPGTTIEF